MIAQQKEGEKAMQIELNYPDPVPVKLEPAKTMLLIVDMENEDLHPTGKRYMGETAAQIIPSIAALRRRIRQAGGLVAGVYAFQKRRAQSGRNLGRRIHRRPQAGAGRIGRRQVHARLLLSN